MARVLFVTHLPDWGGAQKCLYLLLKGLPREKYDPVVLAAREGTVIDRIRELGIPVRYAPIEWWLGGHKDNWAHFQLFAEKFPERVRGIVQIIEDEKIDLVFSNTLAIPDAALAARHCRVPHVWHVLEMLSQDPGLAACLRLESLYNLVFSLSDRVVAVSDAVKRELEQFGPRSNLEVVHTGLPSTQPSMNADRSVLLGIPPETPLVLFVGWLSERKGVLDLIEAAELVLRERPQAKFVLVGPDDGREAEVRRRIRDYGRRKSIHLAGFRQDIPELLSVADIFVLPSQVDPLPLSVLEAMKAGLPVVATRSGGCEDMVADGKTGYLVDVGQPQAMADRLISLLDHPERRAEMGQNGKRRFAEAFSEEQYIRQFERVLDGVLSQKCDRRSEPRQETTRCIQSLLQEAAQGYVTVTQLHAELDPQRAEVAWMKASIFWRLREWLVAIPGLKQLARYLGRRHQP